MEESKKPKKSWISYWLIALCVFMLLQAFVPESVQGTRQGSRLRHIHQHDREQGNRLCQDRKQSDHIY